MIRLAHISDSHFDSRGRLQDVIDVHRAFLAQAMEADVDLILHAGDWFERRSTPEERIAVADFLEAAAHVAPVVGVKGNHDQAHDLDLFPRLEAARYVRIVDGPTATPGSAITIELGDAGDFDGPPCRTIAVLALPWVDKATLVAGLDASIDQEDTRVTTIQAARELLVALRMEAARCRAEGQVPVLVSHAMVAGCETSSGQVLIGTTVELSPADLLEVGAAYVALGHIHKPQEWHGGRVAYSGSPHRCNFGEPEAKGWRLITLTDEGEFVSNEFRELPARRIVLVDVDCALEARRIDGNPTKEIVSAAQREELQGALVRVRYRVRAEDVHLVHEEAIERVLLADGAEEVTCEAVIQHEMRVRSEDITAALDTFSKVEAWATAKSVGINDEQRDRLRMKVASLEGDTHAA